MGTPALIHQWIADISSSRYDTRVAAQQKLIAAGSAIRPALRKTLGGELSPNVRLCLRRILLTICTQRILRGTPVTVVCSHTTAEDAFRSLCRQERLPFRHWAMDPRQSTRRLTIPLLRTSFWKADLRLARASGLGIGEIGGWDPHTVLTDAAFGLQPSWPHCVRGAFVTCLHAIHFHSGMGAFTPDHLSWELTVAVEPTLYVVRFNSTPVLQAATDSNGHSLLLPGIMGFHNNRWPNQFLFTSLLDMAVPLHAKAKLRLLRGYFLIDLDADPQATSFGHAMSQKHQFVIHGVTLDMAPVHRNPYGWSIDYIVTEPKHVNSRAKAVVTSLTTGHLIEMFSDHPASHASCDQTHIVRHQGQRWWCESWITANPSPLKTPPSRVRVTAYTRFFHVKVPFDFKDVPLPSP
ncbi:MAG: hypothetical protein ACP5QA_08120 [Phycisphaerae bacterium]